MTDLVVPVVAVLSVFVFFPVVVVGGILGGRFTKMKREELELRERELAVEQSRLALEEERQRDVRGLSREQSSYGRDW